MMKEVNKVCGPLLPVVLCCCAVLSCLLSVSGPEKLAGVILGDTFTTRSTAQLEVFHTENKHNKQDSGSEAELAWVGARQLLSETQKPETSKTTVRTIPKGTVHGRFPIINLGFPKTGTETLWAYFLCGRKEQNKNLDAIPKEDWIKTSHWRCKDRVFCGTCMKQNHDMMRRPFEGCGDYNVHCQMNNLRHGQKDPETGKQQRLCWFPQIEQLAEMDAAYPNATFILSVRPAEHWLRSVKHFWQTNMYIRGCKFPSMGYDNLNSDGSMISIFNDFTAMVFDYFKDSPPGKFITWNLESDEGAPVLYSEFGIPEHCYAHIGSTGNYTGEP